MMKNPRGNCSGIYVFEGIDNVGKSTVVAKVKEKLDQSLKCNCLIVTFPGNEFRTLGSLVYDIHHNQTKYFDLPLNETSLQLLHIASHIDLIQRKLSNLNLEQDIVLMDRYWWSMYTYGLANGMDQNTVEKILEPELICWEGIKVNRIFLLERENRQHDYDETKEQRIIEGYRELAKKDSKSVVINNNASIEKAVIKIYNNILGV